MPNHPPSDLCNRRRVLASAAGIAFTGLWSSAYASDSRPIKLIVPFAAGSSVDSLARLTSERIAHHLGVPIIIDNRSGPVGASERPVRPRQPPMERTSSLERRERKASTPRYTRNSHTTLSRISSL